MAHELTLTIPDALYQRLESAAQEAQDDVAAVALSALENAFPAFPAHPERAQMQAEVAAYEAMHPELRATHLGQYVAIHQGRLVDWDADPIALHERITERFPNQVVLCRQVRQEPERVLHFRSFHFERPLNNRSTGRV